MERRDLFVAPFCEAALLLIVGLAGWLSHQPLLFTSLGPTAYELIETPHRRSARPYSVIAGHLTGVAAGFIALVATHAWRVPSVPGGGVSLPRLVAAALACGLTVFGTLLIKASQPAALSTTLLIALGSMQRPRDAVIIMGAVVLMVIVGEPLRAWRLRFQPSKDKSEVTNESGRARES
jgi:hypothetical protein